MKKQTAVEFLFEQIIQRINCQFDSKSLHKIFDKAHQIETEQIIESYKKGCNDQLEKDSVYINGIIDKIYNETFEA